MNLFFFNFRSEIQYSIDDDTESLHKELDPDLNTTTPIIKPSSNNKPKGNSSPLASNGDLKGKSILKCVQKKSRLGYYNYAYYDI